MVDSGGGLLIVEAPPRHGKSELVSRRVPLWHLQQYPDRHVTLAGYGAALPVSHSRWVRDALSEHGADLGVSLAQDSTAADRWHTRAGGSCRAVGVGGALTGFGSHLLVIDDPISNAEEADSEIMRDKVWDWFAAVAWTRREPGATVVVMCTRWHEDDLIGRILAHPELGRQAKRITLRAVAEDDADPLGRAPGTALWADRYDAKALEEIHATLPARWWSALYQQRPSSAEGAEIKRHWWRWYDELPVKRDSMDFVCASWDCAFRDSDGSDYVVGTVWGVYGSYRYLLDMYRERADFGATVKAVVDVNSRWRPNATLIEAKANGDAVINTLTDLVPGIVPVEPQGGKESRVRAASPQIQAGNVYLPKTGWANELVEEAAAFPLGKHDDAIDSTAQALNWLLMHRTEHATHLTATDDRWVAPHLAALRARGVLGVAPGLKGRI